MSEPHNEAVKTATAGGDKHLPQFSADIIDEAGSIVAHATHTVQVRRKPAD